MSNTESSSTSSSTSSSDFYIPNPVCALYQVVSVATAPVVILAVGAVVIATGTAIVGVATVGMTVDVATKRVRKVARAAGL